MSSTRTKSDSNGPISQERYMSSAGFAELRGLSGTVIAAKAAIQDDAESRSLLWFLQRMSTMPGGLDKVAEELIESFASRIGGRYRDLYPHAFLSEVMRAGEGLEDRAKDLRAKFDSLDSKKLGIQVARNGNGELDYDYVPSLAEFLMKLCLDPEVSMDEDPIYFSDLRGALLEYKKSMEAKAKAGFQQTAISKKVWETLDFALRTKKMVVVEGLEGRGKTEAVKTWCNFHFGEARFVSLKGITNKTLAFRRIAKALGVACTGTRKSNEMQTGIEIVLERSQLMLVLDEAHFLFSQSERIYKRPELIDWIDTALCNEGVPVALVTTPQFLVCMSRAADQVGWNWKQFRRRAKRYVALAKSNTAEDLAAIARRLIPGAAKEAVKMVVAYALLSKRDASAIGDVAEEARILAEDEGAETINFKHVERAINEQLIPSDKAFAERMIVRKARTHAAIQETEMAADPAKEISHSRMPDSHAFRSADLVSA